MSSPPPNSRANQRAERLQIQLPRLSVRWIVPIAVVTPVLAVAIVLTWIASRTGERTADELSRQATTQVHERIEAHLSHLMNLPPAITRLLQSRLSSGALSLSQPEKNHVQIFQMLTTFPEVSSIVLGSAQGQAMWIIRFPGETTYEYAIKPSSTAALQEFAMDSGGAIAPDALRSSAYNPLVRPWYRAAVDAGGPTWGNIYVWLRGGRGVTLGVPYVQPVSDEHGTLLGVINCELTLADISSFLRALHIGKTGAAFIIERDGNLVATSAGIDCMKNGTDRLPAVEASNAQIAAAAKFLQPQIDSLSHANAAQLEHVVIDKQPMHMAVSSFRDRKNLDWLIVTLIPDSDFLAEVDRARAQGELITLLAVLGALGLGIAIAIWLLRPTLAVVEHARRVGSGDFESRINRRDNREIVQLCTALNDMAAAMVDRMKLRHALDLAMEVQQSLLPSQTPKITGLDIAARSKYCDETGGDYYDYLELEDLPPHALVLALGDVTGHGIAAAMLMATARGLLRSQAKVKGSLGELMTHVNDHLVADTGGTKFMTMFLAVIDSSTMSMRWASAGHDAPIIYDPLLGAACEIDDSAGGLPLGVAEAQVYEEMTYTDLRPGQVMLVGTDGLWEAMNKSDELFGKKRVADALAALAHLSAAEIEAGVYQKLQQFCAGRPNADDITYVVIKFLATP